MCSSNDEYISNIKRKLEDINDIELSKLINKLIDERNYLLNKVNTDILTGLNNRMILDDISNFSGVLMVDIDDFKEINDNYGHDVGDHAIRFVAKILKSSIRSDDYICRFGGDEFVIVFVDCPSDIIRDRAEQIINKVQSSVNLFDNIFTVSIGISINKGNETVGQSIKKADLALYRSKTNGKNQANDFEEINKDLSYKKRIRE